MGKLIMFMTMLILIDMLFIVTGQLALESTTSIIISAIYDPTILKDTNIWKVLIGEGLQSLLIIGGIFATASLLGASSDLKLFLTMGISLGLLVGDYLAIFTYLKSFNVILATLTMGVISILFVFVVIEWVRSKD